MLTPRNLLAVAVAVSVYLLAYRHGRTAASSQACNCGSALSSHDREDERLLEMMPHTERVMVSCLLEKAGTRSVLRKRLYACLHHKDALHPASAARLIDPPSPPPPMPTTTMQPVLPRKLQANEERQGASPPPADPLQIELRTSREAEAQLASAPLGSTMVAAIPEEVLAAASGSARLCLITCVANGKFLTFEPGKDWVQCAGERGVTAPHEGLFAQEVHPDAQLAFRHVRTGKFLQVVPPGSPEAWVVRAHADSVGPSELFEIRTGRGGNSFLFNVGAKAHINRRFDTIVRAHGDSPGKPAGRIPTARMEITFFTAEQLRSEYATMAAGQREAREPIRLQLSRIHALGASNEVRVISYGLYGSNGWKVRVYLDKSVPRPVVSQLEAFGAQLKWMDDSSMGGGIGGMFWRFLVAADPEVDRFIIRDSDSRLNPRERLAVEEWIVSGKRIHSLRDHPNHDRPLNGGMWGGVRNVVPDMAKLVRGWGQRDKYMGDLDFLNQVVWPRRDIKLSQLSHDAYTCHKYPNARPFPTRRPADYQHVGQVFFGDGHTRTEDITGFLIGVKAPLRCRGAPEWTSG